MGVHPIAPTNTRDYIHPLTIYPRLIMSKTASAVSDQSPPQQEPSEDVVRDYAYHLGPHLE